METKPKAVDPSEATKNLAEAELFTAQRDGQIIDNQIAETILLAGRIAAEAEQRKHAYARAADAFYRVYHFTAEVDDGSVQQAIQILTRWNRIDIEEGRPTSPYKFVICSPGGYIHWGMKLYAFIKNLALQRPVITVASGYCASMATILHQAGTERWIDDGTSYLIHDPSGYAGGTMGDIEDTKAWLDQLKLQGHKILAERSKLSAKAIGEKARRKDWWLLADEAVKLGFADKITDQAL
jgi:ATP-dependent protease ClpP protease subunit